MRMTICSPHNIIRQWYWNSSIQTKLYDDDVSNLSVLVCTMMIVRELKNSKYWFTLLILTYWGTLNIIQNLSGVRFTIKYEFLWYCKILSVWKVMTVTNFGRLEISHFEKEGKCKTHLKSWESCLHIPCLTRGDLRFPLCQGLGYHLSLRGPISFTNYSFHMILL